MDSLVLGSCHFLGLSTSRCLIFHLSTEFISFEIYVYFRRSWFIKADAHTLGQFNDLSGHSGVPSPQGCYYFCRFLVSGNYRRWTLYVCLDVTICLRVFLYFQKFVTLTEIVLELSDSRYPVGFSFIATVYFIFLQNIWFQIISQFVIDLPTKRIFDTTK